MSYKTEGRLTTKDDRKEVQTMRVLVVVPAQLGRPFLSEALESLSRQTRRADEIIVAIGQTPLHERLNDAIDASDCDAFIVLCDDDLLEPTYIEKTVARSVETRYPCIS